MVWGITEWYLRMQDVLQNLVEERNANRKGKRFDDLVCERRRVVVDELNEVVGERWEVRYVGILSKLEWSLN